MTLEKALKELMIVDPFYGLFLLNFNKREDKLVKTLGVRLNGTQIELLYNQEFWDKLSDTEQIAVLKHECGHIMYQHLTLYNDLDNKMVSNLAMDAEINADIKGLPDSAITYDYLKESFSKVETGAGTRKTYTAILESLDEQDDNSKSKAYAKCAGGAKSGNGSGNGQNGGSNGSESDALEKCKEQFENCGNHEWGNPSEEEATVIENDVNRILRSTVEQVNRLQGHIPAGIKEMVDNIATIKPAYNWKQHFRRLFGAAEEYFLRKTHKRSSRRFEDAKGTKHVHKSNVLVALDTSGSVTPHELQLFAAELSHVARSGVSIDYTCFDTETYDIVKFKRNKNGFEMQGGGGTEFDAPIQLFNKLQKYDMLIMFTDGWSDWSVNPRHNKCVWLITPNGRHADYPGYTVYMPENINNN